jgi:hypothetical protein
MQCAKKRWVLALSLFAAGGVGCNVSIDQTLAMQEGSGVDVSMVDSGGYEYPMDRLAFEGGTVMRINASASLLDYLDGTVDGDVEVLELLFAVPNFRFMNSINTGLICVVLDQSADNGGTFSYDVLAEEAAFDVFVGTRAVPVTGDFSNFIRGGAFSFPFDLEASIPLPLLDAVGVFTGTGSLVVTQELDEYYTAYVVLDPNDPSQDFPMRLHVKGAVTLESADTFPATEKVIECVETLAGSV